MGWRVEIWWWLEKRIGSLCQWSMRRRERKDPAAGISPGWLLEKLVCWAYCRRKRAERDRYFRIHGTPL